MNIKKTADSQKQWEQFFASLLFTGKAESPKGETFTKDYIDGTLTIFNAEGSIVATKKLDTVLQATEFLKQVFK